MSIKNRKLIMIGVITLMMIVIFAIFKENKKTLSIGTI